MKAQGIRLVDVFFLGPVMVAGGVKLRKDAPRIGAVLALGGIATVLYNWDNYQRKLRENTHSTHRP